MPQPPLEHLFAHAMRFSKGCGSLKISNIFGSSHPTVTTSSSELNTTIAPTSYLGFRRLMDKSTTENSGASTGPLSSHSVGLFSSKLVRTSADLLLFLRLAKKMRTTDEALVAFLDATSTNIPREVLASTGSAMSSVFSNALMRSSLAAQNKYHVTPNSAHITLLMDMCASSRYWHLVLFFVKHFGEIHANIIVHAVRLMTRHRTAPAILRKAVQMPEPSRPEEDLERKPKLHNASLSTTETNEARGWHVACYYLIHHLCLVSLSLPVEAFNVVLSGCKRDGDWLACMNIIRGMGPNPLQRWQSDREREVLVKRCQELKVMKRVLPLDWFYASFRPVVSMGERADLDTASTLDDAFVCNTESNCETVTTGDVFVERTFTATCPDVVSYATLIVTLEQAGEVNLAKEVLNRLPALEKNKITSSYAALISVWSSQAYNRNRRA